MTERDRAYLKDELAALLEWLKQPLNPTLKEIVEAKLVRVQAKLQ
jgi:hypothetical protein